MYNVCEDLRFSAKSVVRGIVQAEELKRNLFSVASRVNKAAAAAGTNVTLVAATKTVPAEVVSQAVALGITDIGENRVQEFREKNGLVSGADWHFIGTLQRNKAKYLVGKVKLIQSVSSLELAKEIDRLAALRGVTQCVLAELNAGDEPDKTGASTGDIDGLIDAIRGLKHVRLCGLMAIPPKDASDGVYRAIRDTFERHKDDAFTTLSVGMSNDFERAISFGSNMVRIGSAIFGRRDVKEDR